MPTIIDTIDYIIALRQKIQQLEQELNQIKTINKVKKQTQFMSEIVFMILCKKCKKVEFNQGDTNLRNCPGCRTTNKNEMRKKYNSKRRQKRNEV